MKFLFRALLLASLLVPAYFTSAQVIISEFLASNVKGITDEDKSFEDWIELRNTSPTNVNLEGWFLTDKSSSLQKWRFPATNLASGNFMIVWASGKDRKMAGAPLHTNFKLSVSGSYLALTQPDGISIATEFSPAYVPQIGDVSYGFGLTATNRLLIGTNDTVGVHVPTDADDSLGWQAIGFNDSTWQSGPGGVGYGPTGTAVADYSQVVLPTQPVEYWRLEETNGVPLAKNVGSSGAASDATYFGTNTQVGVGPRPTAFKGFEPKNNAPTFNGTNSYIQAPGPLLNNLAAFSLGGWIKPGVNLPARSGLFGQNDCVEFGYADSATLLAWTAGGGSLSVAHGFLANTWHHVAVVANGNSLKIFLDGKSASRVVQPTSSYGNSSDPFRIGGGGIFDTSSNFFKGQIDEVFIHHRALSDGEVLSLYQGGTNAVGVLASAFVKTDISLQMSNKNASAYIRIPFRVDEPSSLAFLSLRLRYDDGFVAYINGDAVARVNAPDTLSWDSAATTPHALNLAEEFRIGIGSLIKGTNILAIQGLNLSASDIDFLLQCELTSTSITKESLEPSYFVTPTPGNLNLTGSKTPGPAILSASHSPNAPRENEDLIVRVEVAPTFAAISNVFLRYKVMFPKDDVALQMFDDGKHGDGAAGDGIFGATIPASASTNGEMIRYSIRAVDVLNNTNRFPAFADPIASAEYLGTIVDNPNLTSKLPIVHFFIAPTQQDSVDNQTGGRASVFFDGEFYDNIQMQVRGNSTAGYSKKSHRVEFNREHPFRHPGPGGRIKKTSFTADYPDPSYMRQGLTFWLCNLFGAPAPFYYPMRLQLNSKFYQLANHNDVLGEEMLARVGFDPKGALYNAVGTAEVSEFSTGGFEKKTRRQESDADYIKLASAIVETVNPGLRRTNVFENFDIAEALNYLVVARWVQENDDVWANMSLYHDNDGDGLWRIIPFDMNLSWGAAFGTGDEVDHGLMITNDAHKSFPMYGSSQALPQTGPGGAFNRVYDAFFTIPQTREMYLRRVRTLLDTYVKSPSVPVAETPIGRQVQAWRDLILEEANLDRKVWGWPPNTGQGNFDMGILPTDGINDLLFKYVAGRRLHYQVKHSVNNTTLPIGIASGLTVNNSIGIPNSQPGDAIIQIHSLEVNPASGNQDQEYLCLTNPQPYAVDVSGWQINGAIQFTFHPGTVFPGNSAAFLTPNYNGFKSRTTGPRRGQGLFVIGPYSGHLSARGETLSITTDSGRPVWTNSYPGQPSVAQQYLRVTELMYHPVPSGTPAHLVEDLEFIELRNISTDTPLSLAGVRFTAGVLFNFTTGAVPSLAPGARVLVVGNLPAFKARYVAALPIAGQFEGSLDNAGERIRLVDALDEEVLEFSYNNAWYPLTDGLGFSLVCANELADPSLWNSKSNWRPSAFADATPGAPDANLTPAAKVIINEVLARNDTPGSQDLVELYNPEKTPAEIGGWFLTDDFSKPKKFKVPPGTRIAGGDYLVFREIDFNQPPNGFTLSTQGEEIYLFSADSAGELTAYVAGFSFGASEDRVTFGRHVISTGESHYIRLLLPTLGFTNSIPKVGPLVISEIHYHPLGDASQLDDSLSEFVELVNASDTPTDLFELATRTNTWSIAGGISFTFPTNITLAADESVLIVNFDPQINGVTRSGFLSRYSIPPNVRLFGPYGGKLSNSQDGISLRKPIILPDGSVKDGSVEKVDYSSSAPWPSQADGFGSALHRISLVSYANDPANWFAAAPSPGKISTRGAGSPQITQQPKQEAWSANQDITLSVVATGAATLRYQWRRNNQPITDANQATLVIRSAEPANEGIYDVVVFNDVGSVTSASVSVFPTYGPVVLAPPRGAQVRVRPDPAAAAKTNVTLNVTAYDSRAFTYQWRRDGQNIPGANGSSLLLQDVKVADAGKYTVVIQDNLTSTESAAAEIVALVTPVITQAPLSQTVAAGSPVTLSVVAEGSPQTLGLEWRRGTTLLGTNTIVGTTGYFTFNSTNRITNLTYRVIVRNLASLTTNVAAAALITTVADTDKDGIPDDVESTLGLDPNLAADGLLDGDGDGMSNAAEFIAGTNPKDSKSYLRIDASALVTGAELQFGAVSNRTYTLQFRDQVNGGIWLKLTDVVARPTSHPERILDPGYTTNRFYRVVTPRQL